MLVVLLVFAENFQFYGSFFDYSYVRVNNSQPETAKTYTKFENSVQDVYSFYYFLPA
jgi:hypothetical protein